MKDLILQSAAADGPYIVCELIAPMGRITAVTLQSSEYVYAVSLAPRAGGGEDT